MREREGKIQGDHRKKKMFWLKDKIDGGVGEARFANRQTQEATGESSEGWG